MDEKDVLAGCVMEDCWLTLEQLAAACAVDQDWLARHIDEGLFPGAVSAAGTWRFPSASLLRARRMRYLETSFDAVPELAALMADLLEQMDEMRARLRLAGGD